MKPLAFERQGSGAKLVVLLHGVGGGLAIWTDDASATTRAIAQAGFTAVAVDLPGYGASPLPAAQPLSLATMADAVAATVRALGFERAVVVGHSMGGMVAQELVARDRALVAGLVLTCTSPAFGPPGGDWQQGFLRDRLAQLDDGLGMAGMAAKLIPGMVAPGADPRAAAQMAAVMGRVPEATYRAAIAALVAFDRRATLPEIAVPTLCLAAEHDRTAPPAVMERMAARIPGAEYACLPGAGHVANVERPEAFNALIVDFLERHFDRE